MRLPRLFTCLRAVCFPISANCLYLLPVFPLGCSSTLDLLTLCNAGCEYFSPGRRLRLTAEYKLSPCGSLLLADPAVRYGAAVLLREARPVPRPPPRPPRPPPCPPRVPLESLVEPISGRREGWLLCRMQPPDGRRRVPNEDSLHDGGSRVHYGLRKSQPAVRRSGREASPPQAGAGVGWRVGPGGAGVEASASAAPAWGSRSAVEGARQPCPPPALQQHVCAPAWGAVCLPGPGPPSSPAPCRDPGWPRAPRVAAPAPGRLRRCLLARPGGRTLSLPLAPPGCPPRQPPAGVLVRPLLSVPTRRGASPAGGQGRGSGPRAREEPAAGTEQVLTEHSWPLWAVVLLCDFPAPAAASAPRSPLDLSLAGGGGAESPRTQGHAALAGTSSPFACRARRAVGPARTRLRKTRLSPPWSPAVPWAVDLEALGVFKHLFYRTCVLQQRLEARSGPVCVEARPRVPFVTSRAGHVGSVSARPCVLEPQGFGGLCTRRRELGPGMSGPGCGERPGRAGLKR